MARLAFLALLACCLPLGGCLWLAAGAGAEAGYVAGQKQGASTTVSDQWITTKVKSALIADGDVKARNINVDTTGGVVTLRGFVASQKELESALEHARSTKGVKKVDNRLTLSP